MVTESSIRVAKEDMEALAKTLVSGKGEWNCGGRLKESGKKPVFEVEMLIWPEPLVSGKWDGIGAATILISNSQKQAKYPIKNACFHYPSQMASLCIEFPVPIPEEKFFSKEKRRRFLTDYGVHLIAMAIAKEARKWDCFDLAAEIEKRFFCPRHEKDLKLEQFKKRLASSIKGLGNRLMSGSPDRYQHYR
jgi:hypothetical protein